MLLVIFSWILARRRLRAPVHRCNSSAACLAASEETLSVPKALARKMIVAHLDDEFWL